MEDNFFSVEEDEIKSVSEQWEIVKALRTEEEKHSAALKNTKEALEKHEYIMRLALERAGLKTATMQDGCSVSCVETPRCSVNKAKEDQFFQYLRDKGQGDMIRPYVPPQRISAYFRDLIEEGKEVPEFVSKFVQKTISVRKAK